VKVKTWGCREYLDLHRRGLPQLLLEMRFDIHIENYWTRNISASRSNKEIRRNEK